MHQPVFGHPDRLPIPSYFTWSQREGYLSLVEAVVAEDHMRF